MSEWAIAWTVLTLTALVALAWHDTVVLKDASAKRQQTSDEGDD